MTKDEHLILVAAYENLSREAVRQVVSAMPAAYYESKAAEHRAAAAALPQ